MDKDLFVDPGHVAKYMVGRPKVPKEFANLVVKLIKENSSGVTYCFFVSYFDCTANEQKPTKLFCQTLHSQQCDVVL